jgi:uncharacterized protein YqjF (DUF2071 family)
MTRWKDLLLQREHRPYPPPAAHFGVTMSWHDLLFAHWPVPAATLRTLVPAAIDPPRAVAVAACRSRILRE